MDQIIAFPAAVITPKDRLGVAVEAAVAAFRGLLEELAGTWVTTPGSLLGLEQALEARLGPECLTPFVGGLIREAVESDIVAVRANALLDQLPGWRLQKSSQEVTLHLLCGGAVTVTVAYFLDRSPRAGPRRRRGQRGKAGQGLYPVLEALGIHGRMTPGLAAEAARVAVTGASFDAVREELRRRGLTLDKKTIRRAVRLVSKRALDHRDDSVGKPAPTGVVSPLAGKRLAILVDGGRLRVRLRKQGRRRKNGGKSFHADWWEPKVFVIYELDERGRRKARGFVRYDATLEDADDTFQILASQLRALGADQAALWLVGGDGAKWIWARVGKLIAEVGFDPAKVIELLDFWHAVGYLSEFAEACPGWKEEEQRTWVLQQKSRLRAGRVDLVMEDMRGHCYGRNVATRSTIVERFETNRHRMRYDHYRHEGLPCGSGAVESAVRRVVNLRLKNAGTFWDPAMAEGVLHLRAQFLSGIWDAYMRRILEPEEFWRRHPAREADRQAA